LLLSDNQNAATTKILAKRNHPHDHLFATGRRFTLRLPPAFSSRLSRNSLGIAQQQRQRGLAVEERKIAKIAAIVLDRIEGIQHRAMRSLSAAQLVEA
jgi:hypothetical protein